MHGQAAGGSDLEQQLAAARAATARYHDPNAALADGYIDLGPNPGEGGTIDFVNFDLVDCTLDVRRPEALRYVPSGDGLRLVGVEYSIPMECSATPPEDFLAGAGEWEQEPGVPAWSLAVFIWAGNSIESR
jgi:hypothetical protein